MKIRILQSLVPLLKIFVGDMKKKSRDAFLISGQSCTLIWMPNLKFKSSTESNAGIEMPKRPEGVPEILPIDKNLVQNGDTFDIMRLDGLDPMIAFAMGAATGHTAIALWKEKEVST